MKADGGFAFWAYDSGLTDRLVRVDAAAGVVRFEQYHEGPDRWEHRGPVAPVPSGGSLPAGATLANRDDLSKVIGHRNGLLLMRAEGGRSGFVPNLACSSGRMIYHDGMINPYAMRDMYSEFATVPPRDALAWRVCRKVIESCAG